MSVQRREEDDGLSAEGGRVRKEKEVERKECLGKRGENSYNFWSISYNI